MTERAPAMEPGLAAVGGGGRPPGWGATLRGVGIDGALAILAMLGGSALFLRPMWSFDDGSTKIILAWSALGALAAGVLWQRYRAEWVTFLFRHMPLLLAVTLLAPLSALWSVEPGRSAELGFWQVATTLIAVCIGYSCSPRSVMAIAAWTLATMLVLSLVVVLALPDTGIAPGSGRGVVLRGTDISSWRGIFLNKNELGALASAALAFFTIAAVHRRLPGVVAVPLAGLALAMVVMSGSATAFALAVLSLSIIAIFALSKRYSFTYQTLVLVILISLPTWYLIMTHFDVFTEALNRDATLTTRTSIWQDASIAVADGPFIGHGYRAVWVRDAASWFPHLPTTKAVGEAHNGYLQIAADLGVPAAVAATVFVIGFAARSFDTYVRTGSAFAFVCFVFAVWFMVFNITETRMFQFRRLDWLLFVILAVSFVRSVTPLRRPGRAR